MQGALVGERPRQLALDLRQASFKPELFWLRGSARPKIEEEGGASGKGTNNASSSTVFELASSQYPIFIDLDCEDEDTDSELESAQHPILIEDQDVLPQCGAEDVRLEDFHKRQR